MKEHSVVVLAAFLTFGVWSQCLCFSQQKVEAWFVDPLTKVFPTDSRGKNAMSNPEVLAARNSHASLQLVVRAGHPMEDVSVSVEGLATARVDVRVRQIGYVVVAANTKDTPPSEIIVPAPGLFPDVLYEKSAATLEPGKTQSMWLTFRVAPDSAPGNYDASTVVKVKGVEISRHPFKLRIVAASVPSQQTLKVTNWFYLTDRQLKAFFGVKVLSEEWWHLLENFAHVIAEHRQNMIVTPLTGFYFSKLALIQARAGRNGLEYDFSYFDRWVETFRRAGVIGYIEGSHVLRREDDPDEATGSTKVDVYVLEGGRAVLKSLAPDDSRTPQALTDMLIALYQHLKEKSWLDIYYQHVLDEPGMEEMTMYMKYSDLVHRAMSGVPTLDAVDAKQNLAVYEKSCDVWVPVLGSFDEHLDGLRGHAKRGGEVWYYTCLTPRGKYANRFIDFSLVKVRVLHWINFRYDLTGFLHWGGNYWSPEPINETEPLIGAGAFASMLPSGDAFISYPDPPNRSILSSIRWEAMMEGIEDYELLRQLEKKDPQLAHDIAARMIHSFTEYVRDARKFRQLHAELLGAASKN